MDSSRKILQILFIQVLASQLLIANGISGQDLSDVEISIKIENATIEQVILNIEKNTDFKFGYNKRTVNNQRRITLKKRNATLKDVLLELSEKAGVKFKRIDNHILISPLKNKDKEKQQPIIEVQGRTLSGKVVDVEGNPLVGATVMLKGTTMGALTDLEGNFSLAVPEEDAVIVISYVGFETQEIAVQDKSEVSIVLKESAETLENVVVVGYGTERERDLTGAISDLKQVSQIQDRPVLNAQDILQGNVPGVIVLNDGGDPNKQPIVRVRGIGTINGENPLYVVDGVPNSPLPNPADIASISILKDASAASIYGVRASAGVIIVTTKKGIKDGKAHVNLNAYAGVQTAWKKLEPLNAKEYIEVMNTAFDNAGTAKDSKEREYLDASKNPYGAVTRTNWVDEIFQNGMIKNVDLSVSSGTDKSNFYTSLGYNKTEGTLKNTYAERYSLKLNSTHKILKNLEIGENFTFLFKNGNYGVNTTSGYTGTIITAIYYPSSAAVWEDQANNLYGGVAPRKSKYVGSYGDLINPVAYLERLDDKRPTTILSGNIYGSYEFVKGLTYKINVGINRETVQRKYFVSRRTEPGKIFDFNELYQSTKNKNSWVIENTLNYEKVFDGKHSIKLLGGYTSQKNVVDYYQAYAKNFEFEDKDLRYFGNANQHRPTEDTKGSDVGVNTILSMLGRVSYSFQDKYLFTATVRRDGSSKLVNKDNRWGLFPSASVAWRLSEESFMSGISGLNDLKIRASYGKMGNLAGLSNYPGTVLINTGAKTVVGTGSDRKFITTSIIDGIANPNLKWEDTEQFDIGLNASLLDSKLSFSFDYFIKNTEDMLVRPSLLGAAGVSTAPFENVGSMQNKGFEIALGYNNVTTSSDFKYDISANFSTVQNEVKSLGNRSSIIHDNNVRGVHNPLKTAVGHPVYSFFVYETAGIFQNKGELEKYKKTQPLAKVGDLKFVDQNKDGKLDEKDKVFKGSNFPDFSYGLNLSGSYKGFELSMLWQGVQGVQVFNGLKFSTLKPTQGYNMLKEIKNAWSPTNTGSDIPRISLKDENQNFGRTSDWYLEDASYLRLKYITLAYNIPSKILPMLNGNTNIKIYATAKNLFTFTKYTGMDPEVISNRGIDTGYYPQPRTFIMGLNIGF